MTTLKKYTSFKALKSNEKSSDTGQIRDIIFSEFEAFLKRLRTEYSSKKKTKADNGRQFNR
jgi:hypothetical protein